jgi:hypothetical protein
LPSLSALRSRDYFIQFLPICLIWIFYKVSVDVNFTVFRTSNADLFYKNCLKAAKDTKRQSPVLITTELRHSSKFELGRSVIETFFTSWRKRASSCRALQVPEHSFLKNRPLSNANKLLIYKENLRKQFLREKWFQRVRSFKLWKPKYVYVIRICKVWY